jgi:CRP-like cAMP-binding protein
MGNTLSTVNKYCCKESSENKECEKEVGVEFILNNNAIVSNFEENTNKILTKEKEAKEKENKSEFYSSSRNYCQNSSIIQWDNSNINNNRQSFLYKNNSQNNYQDNLSNSYNLSNLTNLDNLGQLKELTHKLNANRNNINITILNNINNNSNSNTVNNNLSNTCHSPLRKSKYESRIKIFHLANLDNQEDNDDNNNISNLDFSQIELESDLINKAVKRNLKTIIYKGELIKQLSSFAGIGLSPYKRSSTRNIRHKTIDNECQITEFQEGYLNKQDEEFLKERIKKSINCVNLPGFDDTDFTEKIINRMIQYSMKPGKILYNEYEESCFFYIIKSGKFGFFIDKSLKAVYERGSFLGDFSLLNNTQKINFCFNKWTIRCIEEGELFIISSSDLKSLQDKYIKEMLNSFFNFISSHPFLKYLSFLDKKILSEQLSVVKISKKYVIQEIGQQVENLYFVTSGKIEILNIFGESVCILNKGEYFNEEFCLINLKSAYEFRVKSDQAILLCLSKKILIEMMGEDFHNEILFNIFYHVAVANKLLKEIAMDYNFGNESISYFQKPKRPNISLNDVCQDKDGVKIDSRTRSEVYSSNFNLNYNINNFNTTVADVTSKNINSNTNNHNMSLFFNKKNTNKSENIILNNQNTILSNANNSIGVNKSYTKNSLQDRSRNNRSELGKQDNNNGSKKYQILDDSYNSYYGPSPKNPYRNLFEKFKLIKYDKGKDIYAYDIKKCVIIIQGSIESKTTNKTVSTQLDVIGYDFNLSLR